MLDGLGRDCTSQQQNTHIGERRDIHYPWHPWHDRKVRVHATLVKRGQAVARCSVEEVPPFRILEVPLWMLDAAACCNIRAAKSGVANVESLRALKAVLRSTPEADLEFAIPAQHPYWLDPGGADVRVANSTKIDSTPAVCPPASETGLGKDVPRSSTQDSAIADAATATALRQAGRRTGDTGGGR